MQLDRNALTKLLGQSDAELWQAIVTIGKEAGYDLSNRKMSDSDMAKLRKALSGASDEDIRRAAKKLEAHKNKTGGIS